MKDIEDLLSGHSPRPKRKLSGSFTKDTIAKLDTAKPSGNFYRRQPVFRRWQLNKAGLLALGALVVLGGTAAAIALWPSPSVTQTSSALLPSGNHIVGVNAKNCHYFGDLDGTAAKTSSENIYYEVRQGSALTDNQIVSSLEGICEENISNNAISAIEQQLPAQGDSTAAYVINSISSSGITITVDPHYNGSLYTIKPGLTYSNFSNNLLVYDENTKITYSDLMAGDTVKLIFKDTSGKPADSYKNDNPLNHPENITILAILKIPALTADPDTFYTAIGKDIVRVEPCSNSPTGFCRAYQFEN